MNRTLGAGALAALAALTITITTIGPASAQAVASEHFGGAARARAAAVTLQGERVTFASGTAGSEVDSVRSRLQASAAGIGTDATPETAVSATAPGDAGEGCAVPQFGALLVSADAACGSASVSGTASEFVARGSGRAGAVTVSGAGLLASLPELPSLQPILDEHLGDLVHLVDDASDEVEAGVASGLGTLNATLDSLVGEDLASLVGDDPAGLATDTLEDLLERVSRSPLVVLRLAQAASTISGTPAVLTSQAVDDGAVLDVLPGFMPDGSPLARVTVGASMAEVVYDRSATTRDGATRAPEVSVESPLVGQAVTLAEGESVSLFCDGDAVEVPDLCTTVAVGHSAERTVGGRLQVEAAAVTVEAAKGLDLGTVTGALSAAGLPVGPRDVLRTVNGLLDEHDLSPEGVATAASPAGGVRVELAGAAAQGGGARVLGSARTEPGTGVFSEPFEGELPRTGGAALLPYAATALLGGSAALRRFARREARFEARPGAAVHARVGGTLRALNTCE